METEEVLQYRDFIQNTITRMNGNSFNIKKWMVTIIAGFIGFYASSKNLLFIVTPIPIVLIFGFLDAYYLQLERKFRGLYNDTCGLNKEKDKTTINTYDMNISRYRGGNFSFWSAIISPSILPLYICLILCLGLTKLLH